MHSANGETSVYGGIDRLRLRQRLWLFYCVLFLFLLLLCYLFPYMGDDWAWGSDLGLERLSTFFAGYNGRYSGNLLILALSRQRPLRALTEAAVLTGIISAVTYLAGGEKRNAAVLSSFLLLTCGRTLFRQSVAWASGFCNYVVPVLFILLYLCCRKAVQPNSEHEKRKPSPALNVMLCAGMLALSFVTSMFVEHVTIFVIVLAAATPVIEKIKYRRIQAFGAFYLAGALGGAALMFSNGAYDSIIDGADGYRTMAAGVAGLTARVFYNAGTIFVETVKNNLVLNTVTTVLLSVLACRHLMSEPRRGKASAIRLIVAYNIAYVLYTFFAAVYPKWKILLGYTLRFEILISFFYLLFTFLLSMLCLKSRQRKLSILFCFACVAILTLPLFFVTPIGGRCFFPSYVIQILIACFISEEAISSAEKSAAAAMYARQILGLGVAAACVFRASIFGYVFKTELRRNGYVEEQLKEGRATVYVIALPYAEFMWNANPSDAEVWTDRYKDFFGIDEDTKTEVISLEEYLYGNTK
jgi:hypothetical protein